MSNQSLTEFVCKTTFVFGAGYIISRATISLFNHFTSKYQTKDAPWNQGYPTFEFLVSRPENTNSQFVLDTIRKYLDNLLIPATCTISDATCMYNGKFPATEPCHRVLLTFNPMRVDPDTAQQVAEDLATHLAKEFKQFIIPGYEYRTARVFKGIGNVPTIE